MRKSRSIFLAGLISTVLLSTTLYRSIIEESFRESYLKTLGDFSRTSEKLFLTAQKKEGSDELIRLYHQARKNYKSIEFLADYLDHEFCVSYLNGAPLIKLEKNAPVPTPIYPVGLQKLEELVYEHHVNTDSLIIIAKRLSSDTKKFHSYQKSIPMEDRHAFEAIKAGLVRVFTLDFTGFDSPVSDSALVEAFYSFRGISRLYHKYEPSLRKKNEQLYNETTQLFEQGLSSLKSEKSFDDFDRLQFLRTIINPLSVNIEKSRSELGIESWSEVYRYPRPINEGSDLLFDRDYLDPYSFASLSRQEDNEKVLELGKALFFDPILSSNNERSCASCHNPRMAFSDGKRKSTSFDKKGTTPRNSPGLINSVYAEKYFHDLRAEDLPTQIENVLFSQKEFASNWKELEKRLYSEDEFPKKFSEAFPMFGDQAINKHTVTSALSSYLISLSGNNSPFDLYARGESDELDPEAIKGFNLFMGKAGCGTCHFAPTFSGLVPPYYYESESEVLGVPSGPEQGATLDTDPGRFGGQINDRIFFFKHSFKTPTVRNIGLTAPYMHNGVYDSLEQVMVFYNEGGGLGLGLDVPFQTLPPDSLHLDEMEIQQIISFMNSLEDLSSADVETEVIGY